MIIKSKGRKSASFSQLLNYIEKGKDKSDNFVYLKNIYSTKKYFIVQEFLKNCEQLKKRKDNNYLYHEIISLKKQENLSAEELKKILQDVLDNYCEIRAKNCLVYGAIHEDNQQIHCHLMISANELNEKKNHNFSKSKYNEITKNLNLYVSQKYPLYAGLKLEKRKGRKRKDNEEQLKRRTGKASNREQFKERVKNIFDFSRDPQEFISALEREKISIYQRGKTFGFLDQQNGRKYRLNTLELEEEFADLNRRFTTQRDAGQKAENTAREDNQYNQQEKSQNASQGPQEAHTGESKEDEYRRELQELAERKQKKHLNQQTADKKLNKSLKMDSEEAYRRELQELAEKRKKKLSKKRGLSH